METGRYTVPKTPEYLRICSLCQANKVENNVTLCFLALYMIRFATNFVMKSLPNITFFNDLDVRSKILFLFNNIDPFICKSVAAYIFEIMNCRHDHVISKVT